MDPNICSVCHQPILPQYYFCPNCGNKLNSAPLSSSIEAQTKLYALSLVLPLIGFLFLSKWKGNRYYKSQDEKLKRIGMIAWGLILLSTIFTIWLVVKTTQNINKSIESQINAINTDGF